MTFNPVICSLAVLTMLGGCVSGAPAEPEPIKLEYLGDDNTALTDDAPCIWVEDRRSRQAFYGVTVPSADALSFMSDGITSRLRAKTRATDTVPGRGLLISLLKAYINPNGTTLSAVVAIKVTWGERESVYRGQVVQTNWWGAEREISRTMSAALDEALLKINFPVTTSTCDQA
ncbi:MAG: hypothetical protein OEZ11_16210 [Gammaproteobacteria bacterium]|nr:hypothetical protein [Gammaproteobacteria bacterium]